MTLRWTLSSSQALCVRLAELDDQLEKRVLDVETQWERRATNLEGRVDNLERWRDGIAGNLNAVQDRADNLEHRW